MSNQISTIPFGTDASKLVGYATRANERLGGFDLIIENTGSNTLSMQVRTLGGLYGTTWTPIEAFFTVVPQGNTTRHYAIVNQVIGFFGSGNTTANVSSVIRNPAGLRGGQIDIYVQGKKNWGFDPAYATGAYTPVWGSPPDNPNVAAIN